MSNKFGHSIKRVKDDNSIWITWFCTKCKIEFFAHQNVDDGYYPVKSAYHNLTCDEVKVKQVMES